MSLPKTSITGRLLTAMTDAPALQNIPVSADWPKARKTERPVSTTMHNYLVQAQSAEKFERAMLVRLIEQGFTEIAPGIYRHPCGSEVSLG